MFTELLGLVHDICVVMVKGEVEDCLTQKGSLTQNSQKVEEGITQNSQNEKESINGILMRQFMIIHGGETF